MSKFKSDNIMDDLLNSLLVDTEVSPIRDKNRQMVYITLGKLGYKHGKRKILGIYPTEKQAQDRAAYCSESGDMDLLFRDYSVAKILVGSSGSDVNLEF